MRLFLAVRFYRGILKHRNPARTTPHRTAPYDYKYQNPHRTIPFDSHLNSNREKALGPLKSSRLLWCSHGALRCGFDRFLRNRTAPHRTAPFEKQRPQSSPHRTMRFPCTKIRTTPHRSILQMEKRTAVRCFIVKSLPCNLLMTTTTSCLEPGPAAAIVRNWCCCSQ